MPTKVFMLALILIPALALPGCQRKKDRDVNVIIYDADGRTAVQQ